MSAEAVENLQDAAAFDLDVESAAKALADDQEAKKPIVIDAVTSKCTISSPFEDLRIIGSALQEGDTLVAEVLSGGKTNFSYRVYLEKAPETAVFAKICFEYASWNPDKTAKYDLKRTDNEFLAMHQFSKMMGSDAPIATPYHCISVSDTMKVLITQWSQADEQWSNQFIDGEVDRRVIPKLAEAFATLNCAEFDPNFNDNVRPFLSAMFPVCKALFSEYIRSPDPVDDCVALMRELGQEKLDDLVDQAEVMLMECRECLVHSDAHTFNILVESKPILEKLELFGEKGDVVICDWEMTYAGSSGKDVGATQFFPISCLLCHAVQGRRNTAYDILECMELFWNSYAKALVKTGGKDECYMRKAYRSSLACCGLYLCVIHYMMKFFQDVLPLDGVSKENQEKALGSIGYVGLQFLQYGLTNKEAELSLDGLKERYRVIIVDQIEVLLQAPSDKFTKEKRSSVLRQTGRRVSDAGLLDEATLEMTRRLSTASSLGRRRSSLFDPILAKSLYEG